MSFEVETKFRGGDFDALCFRLQQRGATAGPTREITDHYLAHPSRDFRQTDEAVRIRRIDADNRVTYKGPKLAGPTKTREEVEVPFAPGPDACAAMLRVFEALGFTRVATVVKRRRSFELTYQGRTMEVVLDELPDLGRFAEVETLTATAADLPDAQSAVLGLAGELGLTDVEARSYLRMILEKS